MNILSINVRHDADAVVVSFLGESGEDVAVILARQDDWASDADPIGAARVALVQAANHGLPAVHTPQSDELGERPGVAGFDPEADTAPAATDGQ